MKRIVETVPNFSEGRRREVVEAIAAALTCVRGAALLDLELDAAHHRSVITVAGEPEAVAEGVLAGVGKAVELIDLRVHRGEHPRMGAADVIPFVPISGITMEECVELSVRVASEIARRFGIPVYLYEQSARIETRRDLAAVRRGEFEGIREEIRTRTERRPDFGPPEVHPSAGAVAVGARHPLIAYNVYLESSDLEVARAVARAVRFSSGGLPHVKALGLEIRQRGQVQVSMNLTHYRATPIHAAFDRVALEAERRGVEVASSEIIGLVPREALEASAARYLRLEGFSGNQILENRLAAALPAEPGLDEFVERVAAPEAVPGGGSVAALAGALAAALGLMVSGLTAGREKYRAAEPRVIEIREKLAGLRRTLQELIAQDMEAYAAVMQAYQLPKATEEEQRARAGAVERATRRATEVPLRTARASADAAACLEELARIGNVNARSDAAVGAQLAFAALKGGEYNVLINLAGIRDDTFAAECRSETESLAREARAALDRLDALMRGA